MTKSPIVIFVFNRPDLAYQVFKEIRNVRPNILFIVSDGPRLDRVGEWQLVQSSRELVKLVDWPCDIRTNFAETNLGCRARIQSGLDWVFTQVDRAIILEDDCLPAPSFFRYCDEMLSKFYDNHRILAIAGTNPAPGIRQKYDIYYSSYPHIWGWATWRRSWLSYEREMTRIEEVVATGSLFCGMSSREIRFWNRMFKQVQNRMIDTWDAQVVYQAFRTRSYTVYPSKNLIENIGFRADATHTKWVHNTLSAARQELPDHISVPPLIEPSRKAEAERKRREGIGISLARRILNRIERDFQKWWMKMSHENI